MSKKALLLVVLLGIIVAAGLVLDVMPLTIKGEVIHGPLHTIFGSAGSIISLSILLYLAVLSAPLLGCLGMIMVSALAMASFIMFGMVLPLLLPALVLSLILWAYRSGERKGVKADPEKLSNGHAEARP